MKSSKNTYQNPDLESNTIEDLSKKLLQATKDLSKKNAQLAESERKRKEMVANISHDLRAPLTAIRSAVDLLNSYERLPEEDVKNALGLINRRVATLESLVQDMYFLFCVEDDNRDFDLEEVDLAPFLESYFYDAIVDSRYDNHEMKLDIPVDLNCKVNIDIQKTIRVLDNLFVNAAKYSGDGTVITLSCHVSGGLACIVVSDNGVGIPPKALEHVFDRTYTVSSSRSPASETGSGLGLAIVKAVIEKESGSIHCKSELKKGSRFIIELPVLS